MEPQFPLKFPPFPLEHPDLNRHFRLQEGAYVKPVKGKIQNTWKCYFEASGTWISELINSIIHGIWKILSFQPIPLSLLEQKCWNSLPRNFERLPDVMSRLQEGVHSFLQAALTIWYFSDDLPSIWFIFWHLWFFFSYDLILGGIQDWFYFVLVMNTGEISQKVVVNYGKFQGSSWSIFRGFHFWSSPDLGLKSVPSTKIS